jgi:hypothetical protein
MDLEPNFSSVTKIDSKWMKDLNLGLESMKLLEENIEEIPQDIGMHKDLGGKIPKAQKIKAQTDRITSN